MRVWAAAALVAVFLMPTPLAASDPTTWPIDRIQSDLSEVVRSGDTLVHSNSGYVFPASIADMPARRTTTYGDGDASVNYSRYGGGNGDAWVDIFVYPATSSLDDESVATQQALTENIEGRVIARPSGIAPPIEPLVERWFEGQYAGVRVTSAFRISKVGGWFIKARVTIPADGRKDALDRAGRALQSIDFNPRELGEKVDPAAIPEAA